MDLYLINISPLLIFQAFIAIEMLFIVDWINYQFSFPSLFYSGKAQRIKAAKREADSEIQAFKNEKDAQYKAYEAEVS